MILVYGLVAVISGAITYYLLKPKKKEFAYIHDNYTQKPFDYGGVRPFEPIKDRVMFYPYNYVNG